MAITFNGVDIPSFVKVNKIVNSILPAVNQRTVEVPGRDGLYDFGNKIGTRKIEVDYTIIAIDEVDLRSRVREFANWLYYDDAKPLVINDEPDKTYYAKVAGNTELDEILHIGQGTVQFICYDPYAYGVDKTVDLTQGEITTAENTGDTPVFPKLHFEFTQPTTEFAIVSGERYMYFGAPANVDTHTGAPKRTLVLSDDCSSTASYTAGIGVDGGDIDGSFTSDGNVIKCSDYGTGTGWHGAAGVRTLGQQIQDFTLQADVSFKKGAVSQVGRIEIYLLDQNNVIIGKIAIRDGSAIDNPYLEARAGALSGGKYFVNYVGKIGRWKQFTGQIRVQRIGKQWRFWAFRKSNGKITDFFTYPFFDKDSQFQQQLSGFQIHIGTHSTLQPLSTVHFDKIEVWNENTYNPSTEVPYVFENGDKLDIDCSTGVILKNEEPFYTSLDPSSAFLKLEKGSNNIGISPSGIFDVGTLTYKERWR